MNRHQSLHPSWTRWLAVMLAVAPAVAAIWSVPWFLTQDGPAHLYNAQIIAAAGDPQSPYGSIYAVRKQPLPNWAGHILSVVMVSALPSSLAEKAVVTTTLLSLVAATVCLRSRVKDDSTRGAVATAALAAILGLNVTWLFGFTGFNLGAALFAVTLGVWWSDRDRMGAKSALKLAGLTVVGYFCHPVSLGLTAFGLVTLAVLTPSAPGRWRRVGWTALGLAPLVPLGLIYRGLTRAGGPMRPEFGYLAAPFAPGTWLAQLGWVDPISLASKVQRPFGTTASALNAITSPALWTALGLGLLVVSTLRDRARSRVGFGWVALILCLAGLFGPDTMGVTHGHYLPQRVVLLGLVAAVPWLGLDGSGRLAGLGRGCLVVALIFQTLFVFDYAAESQRTAGRLLAAAPQVGRDHRVAAVMLGIHGRFRMNPLLHADCILGIGTGNIIWGDYETTHYYFPVQLRDPSSSPPALALEAIAMMEDPRAIEERARRWSDLVDRYATSIDLVLIWGRDTGIEAATSRRYRRVHLSDDDRVQVWVRGDPD